MIKLKTAIGRSMRLLVVALSLHATGAYAQSNGANSIQALNVGSAPDGKLVIAVTLKNPPAALPGQFAVANPASLVFDFPGATNASGKTTQEVNQDDLRSLKIVQGATRTRLVLSLYKMMSYDSRIEGNNVVITLSTIRSAPKTTHFAEPMPSQKGHALRGIEFHRGNSGEGRVEVALSDPGTGIDLRQEGAKLVVDFINTKAPRDLQRKLDVLDFATPVESVETFAQGNNVRMEITPRGLWEHAAYQTDNKFVVEVKPRRPEERAKKVGPPVFTGDKLTLNFQNISVREALSVIADFTQLNVVISDSVTGNLTLRLKDVPWDQALDIILKSKGLDQRRSGNVVTVAPAAEIATQEKVTMTVEAEVADLTPLHTESFTLSYQKGQDIVKLISDKAQPILSKRGSAVVDMRTNTVFIKDTPDRLDEVRALIAQIDVPVRQVMIEARFVSATEKFNRELGGRLAFANSGTPAGFAVGGGQLGNAQGAVNLPIPSSGISFSLFNPSGTKTLTLELAATELDGTSKSIASPRVVTADNVSASIAQGTEIPYAQASTSGATTIAFKDATLKLDVTPKITPDDHINMKLTVNQDTVGNIYAGVPSIDTKKVVTEVLVDNGGTVVIGGVYTKDDNDSTAKIPLLGDIPIIGWFFKDQVVFTSKTELLIFITPRILKDTLNLN